MDYSKIASIISKIRNLEMELKNELRGMDLGPIDQPKNSVATAPMPALRNRFSIKLVDWLKANISNGGIGYAELMAGYRKATGRSGQSAGQQLRYLTEKKIVTYDRVSGIVKLR